MTLPVERTRAILLAEEFLLRLANDKAYRSLKDIRETARMILRHYPWQFDISRLCEESDRFEWPADFERDGVRVAPIHFFAKRPGVGRDDIDALGREVGALVSETREGVQE